MRCTACNVKITKENLGFQYYGQIFCKKCKDKKGGFKFEELI